MLRAILIAALVLNAQMINTGPYRKVFVPTPSCSGEDTGFVQANVAGGAFSCGVTFTSSVTNTDTLIYFTRGHTGATTTVTDTGLNSYSFVDSLVGTVPNTLAYAALGVTGGSSFTINGSGGGFAELPYCVIAEFAPRSAIDAATGANGNTTSLTSAARYRDYDYRSGRYSGFYIQSSDSGSITAPAGFASNFINSGGGGFPFGIASCVTGAPGVYNASWTGTANTGSNGWAHYLIALKP